MVKCAFNIWPRPLNEWVEYRTVYAVGQKTARSFRDSGFLKDGQFSLLTYFDIGPSATNCKNGCSKVEILLDHQADITCEVFAKVLNTLRNAGAFDRWECADPEDNDLALGLKINAHNMRTKIAFLVPHVLTDEEWITRLHFEVGDTVDNDFLHLVLNPLGPSREENIKRRLASK